MQRRLYNKYAIFFSDEGVAIQPPVKKSKSVTKKCYKDVVLKKLEKYYQKQHPAMPVSNMCDSYNAPAHNYVCHCYIFFFFFAKREGNTFLSHQTLPLVTSSFFRNWKFSSLDGYWSRQKLGSAVYQYFNSIPKSA